MSAQETLKSKENLYVAPCCSVPLDTPNPECVWHGYRSLMVDLARVDLPEEMCARVLTVETRAMTHVLRFFRDGVLKAAAARTLTDSVTPAEVLSALVDDINRLLSELEG